VTRSLTVVLAIVGDLIAVLFRSRAAVIAENLFLRRQLALYLERKTRRRRPSFGAQKWNRARRSAHPPAGSWVSRLTRARDSYTLLLASAQFIGLEVDLAGESHASKQACIYSESGDADAHPHSRRRRA
jgi:hypothetical protein